jgi:hypothetical protein
MQYVLLIVVCTLATCFPEVTKKEWKYNSYVDCVKDGYYKTAEVANKLIDIEGFSSYNSNKYKYTFYCVKKKMEQDI